MSRAVYVKFLLVGVRILTSLVRCCARNADWNF